MTDYVIEDGRLKFDHIFSNGDRATVHLVYDESQDAQAQIDAYIAGQESLIDLIRNYSDSDD